MKDDKDLFYKELASYYAEKQGEEYKKLANQLSDEAENTKNIFPKTLDKRIKGSIRRIKLKKFYPFMAVAASLVLIIAITIANDQLIRKNDLTPHSSSENSYYEEDNETDSNQINNDNLMKEKVSKIQIMSGKLPDNYHIYDLKEDVGEQIFYIQDDKKEKEYILSVKEHMDDFDIANMDKNILGNKEVYVVDNEEYKLLTFFIDEKHYILTTEYYLQDIFDIGESIIEKML